MLRAFKYRLYPTEAQKILLSKHFGCVRWVYNWALAEKMKAWDSEGKSISIYELQGRLPAMKKDSETEWLSEVSAQSLCGALMHLDAAYTRFFKEKNGFPRFKAKGYHDSFQNHQSNSVDFEAGRLYTFKFREGIKCRFSRRFEGVIKTTTISRTATGKYYASILVQTPEAELPLMPADEARAIGLDFGLKDLIVTSDGQRFVNPRHLKRHLRLLRIRQRRLSRKVKGSRNREKARLRVALLHEHISNVRRDCLHKISHHLVCESQATTICIEDLSITDMLTSGSRSRALNRSIQDVGWGMLRQMLEYKCRWNGKNLRVIGRFEPSSKTCSACGAINGGLTLDQRDWTCQCGVRHDRDINAAVNIRRMAFRQQNTSSKPITPACRRIPTGSRKSTPVDQAVRPEMKRECLDLDHS